jgi:hypothetical protein
MADSRTLDAETRAFAMVGQFLQAFALMETALHNAIGAALCIEKVKIQILGVNIEFSKKVHILRTLIDVSDSFSAKEKRTFKSNLKKLVTYAETRKMVAHCAFEQDESAKGVSFLHIKASGEFSAPQKVWNDVQFQEELRQVYAFEALLVQTEKKFQKIPVDPLSLSRLPWEAICDVPPMRRTLCPASAPMRQIRRVEEGRISGSS